MLYRAGMRRAFLAAVTCLVALGVLASGAYAATATSVRTFDRAELATTNDVSPTPATSSNWSGYAALGTDTTPVSFGDVTASWIQPKATCTIGQGDTAAFWVGIGGFDPTATSLEQLGTETVCDGSGAPATSDAWWEIVPAASVRIPLKINAGDHITAALVVKGQTITMSLRNTTRKTRFSKVLTVSQQLDTSSAEWIAEAPSVCGNRSCRVLPLSQFGTVTFTNAAAIGNNTPGTISAATWTAEPIDLIPESGAHGYFGRGAPSSSLGAVPGTLSADGRSFSVTAEIPSAIPTPSAGQ